MAWPACGRVARRGYRRPEGYRRRARAAHLQRSWARIPQQRAALSPRMQPCLRSSSSHSVRSRTLDTVIGLILIPRSRDCLPSREPECRCPRHGWRQRTLPKGRRVEQRVDAIGQLPRIALAKRARARPRYRRRSRVPSRLCWLGVGDDLYSLPFRGRDRVLSQKPSATAHG